MLKTISSSELKVGMYVCDLTCDWLSHPFARNRFLLTKEEDIAKIQASGIRKVVIDSAKGTDLESSISLVETQAQAECELVELASTMQPLARVSLYEELDRAKKIRNEASSAVRTVMRDARLGRAVELEQVAHVVTDITSSILRNPAALTNLMLIKNADEYTFLHSVSVCALLVSFCQARGHDHEITYQVGLGGLLHDTGKALVPDHILNKTGPLTAEEFEVIKRHPRDGYDILLRNPEIGAIPLDIALHHHERKNGTGYPEQQSISNISEYAQMAAIVDVYDAISSDRCYHVGLTAAVALRKIYEWTKGQFDMALVKAFIQCIGIYPVGTLVMLESGRLGVVVEPHPTNLLSPKVTVFFNTKTNAYIAPRTVDLSKGVGHGGADKILNYESPRKWQVDPSKFMYVTV
jgi:HD-GYP domain-containing protein (c-di-GMP phosphodiesterase class II)